MAISGEACYIFGGYDGTRATDSLLHIDLQPVLQLQRSSVADLAKSMACCGAVHHISNAAEQPEAAAAAAAAAAATGVGKAALRALNKAAAPAPLKLADLPNAQEVSAMPQWKQIRQLHQVRHMHQKQIVGTGVGCLGRFSANVLRTILHAR
jgi:hypothetical protein